ncbi:MAG: hypothetical protein ACT4PY_15345 [Armatimonadota bacterium]
MQMGRPEEDGSGKWLGIVVFLVGIVFLIVVFVLAYRDLIGAGVLGQLSGDRRVVEANAALITLGIKFAMFIVMAYVGSAVAGRGIGMYAASRSHEV